MKLPLPILLSLSFIFTGALTPRYAHADDLAVFLRSCAYGTAAGAILGLGVVALSEDPSKHFNTVARGASLGLYTGIGVGLYTIYGAQRGQADWASSQAPRNMLWFSTLQLGAHIDGAQVNWAQFSF